jgi:LysM repeat protein
MSLAPVVNKLQSRYYAVAPKQVSLLNKIPSPTTKWNRTSCHCGRSIYYWRKGNIMGIFDKMFGRGASEAEQQQGAQQRFNELKQRYQTVLTTADNEHIQFLNLHVQDNKLFIRGIAPSDEAKNRFWDQIKLVNPNADDITADISVDTSRAAAAAAGGGQGSGQTYEVRGGDNLSKISKQFYGDPNEYMRIFYANRDKLHDPDKIQVGQKLTIPPAE